MKHLYIVAITVALLALPTLADAHQEHHCRPFRGASFLSVNYRVKNVKCSKADRVIRKSVRMGGRQRHHFHAIRLDWRTHKTGSYGRTGFKQVWISGTKRIWIIWLQGAGQ